MPTAPTASTLVRELARRMGELRLATAAGTGTATTLVDQALLQFFPGDVGAGLFNAWVYGSTTADASNRGVERRASSWTASTYTMLFYGAGWPTAVTTGTYEVHTRSERARKLEAINTGVRELDLSWYRHVMDETSLLTVAKQARYTLPTGTNWSGQGWQIQIQVNTDTSYVGYPYTSASMWDPQIHAETDANGVTTWYLQFGMQPPVGRHIRILGEAGFSDLVADADILPLDAHTAGRAYEWLLKNSMYQLWLWEGNKMPAGQIERILAWAKVLREEELEYLQRTKPNHRNSRLIVPGRGTGTLNWGLTTDPRWLAAFRQGY